MLFGSRIAVITTRAVYVNGEAFPEGARLRLDPAEAWEGVAGGYLHLADEADAPRARDAFLAAQRELMRKLNGASTWRLR